MVEKFIKDDFDGETRYKTFTCLTNAISLALGGEKLNRFKYDKIKQIWDNYIVTELCQHFIPCSKDKKFKDRNSVETKYTDFEKSDSFAKLISLLNYLEKNEISIKKIMVLGIHSFRYIKENCEANSMLEFHSKDSSDGYWHDICIKDKKYELLYTWHPSFSGYYDKDKDGESLLVPELSKFFDRKHD